MSDSSAFAFMPEEKRQLLSLLLKAEGIELPAQQILSPKERPASLPLSFAQQRLYFLDQLAPGQAVYNNASAFRLVGPLDTTVLERSFNEIVRRHESLRTTFVVGKDPGGMPEQVITPACSFSLPIKDLRFLDASKREQEARRLTDEEIQRPFDLARGPLFRFLLLKLETQVHLLLVITHHIISDGLSLHLLLRELSTLYATSISHDLSPLAELPVQYADFAIWQHKWYHTPARQKLLNYWRTQLQDIPPLLQLPTDHSRPPVQTYQGRSLDIFLPRAVTLKLKELSRQENVTLFMTLLAAFQTLLYRYTGQSDLVVSSPIANRTSDKLSHVIGFFANMLLLRTNMEHVSSFRELLQRIRNTTLDAYAHQELPFEQLVEELAPERNLSYTPIFQVAFVLQEHPLSSFHLTDIQISSWPTETGTSKFDLTLILEETSSELSGRIEYSTALFEEVSIRRMREHLQILLENIVRDPTLPLRDFPLLSESEQRHLLVDANATQTAAPLSASIHEIFAQQVEQTPEARAIVFQDQDLTYRQLNEQANSLALRLRKEGVGPETRVGISLDRSPALLIALVAVLKAGGAYVPLDPAYPTERLAFLCGDADVSVLLTSASSAAHFRDLAPTIVCLDTEYNDETCSTDMQPPAQVSADNLAYIMYTSGSTGRPKGIGTTHRNVVNLVKENTYARFATDEVLLHLAPFAFDASTFEIWGTLLNGGTLVLCPSQTPSLEEISHILEQQAITTLWLTSGLFHQMVEAHLPSLRGLKQLLAGGDVVSSTACEKVLRQASGVRFINGYGPTECTTFSCTFTIDTPARLNEIVPTVPIGRPIGNVQVYILDEKLRPVPVGIPGELYIAGPGLARGYLGQPALTAEHFLPNPFCFEPGARMYKTGDLVRYKNDGNIEFLGRIDRQVKLRGFRIEPGEIEAVLARHASVQDVAVVTRDKMSQQGKYLLAYLVPADRASLPLGTELRSYAQQKLPAYMVPTEFVWLDSLPLTRNGKLDSRALPLPEETGIDVGKQSIAPRDALEKSLLDIWTEVFHLECAGIEENFFDLGGHSLMATQVLSRIHTKLHIELPMRSLFEFPTVAGLAAVIRGMRDAQDGCFRSLQDALAKRDVEMLLEQIDEMDDDEVSALIEDIYDDNEEA